jgi:hypothetical protein
LGNPCPGIWELLKILGKACASNHIKGFIGGARIFMKLITLIEALISFSCSIYCFLYYSGRINYRGDKEKDRKEKVEKHGNLIFSAGVILTLAGIGLLINIF